jgi:hypothetical protein
MFLVENIVTGKSLIFPLFGGDPSNNIKNVFHCLVGIKNIFPLLLIDFFFFKSINKYFPIGTKNQLETTQNNWIMPNTAINIFFF